MTSKYFTYYARFVVVYVIAVIMWGAYVRATGSGAGCGEHWPTCNGEVIPRAPSVKTMIEFSHRLTSGLSLIFVAALAVMARRIFPKGHATRRAAGWSFLFICGEAAVGAMLVLLALVANNDSALRALVIALHLLNTFLLLYWLVFSARSSEAAEWGLTQWKWAGVRTQLFACLAIYCAVGSIGAVVALGDTLFPSQTLSQGFSDDLSGAAHFLVRLRIFHPILAVVGSIYAMIQLRTLPRDSGGVVDSRWANAAILLLLVQLASGAVNVVLLAPVTMQMIHLMLADITWIVLVVLYVDSRRRITASEVSPAPVRRSEPPLTKSAILPT